MISNREAVKELIKHDKWRNMFECKIVQVQDEEPHWVTPMRLLIRTFPGTAFFLYGTVRHPEIEISYFLFCGFPIFWAFAHELGGRLGLPAVPLTQALLDMVRDYCAVLRSIHTSCHPLHGVDAPGPMALALSKLSPFSDPVSIRSTSRDSG